MKKRIWHNEDKDKVRIKRKQETRVQILEDRNGFLSEKTLQGISTIKEKDSLKITCTNVRIIYFTAYQLSKKVDTKEMEHKERNLYSSRNLILLGKLSLKMVH